MYFHSSIEVMNTTLLENHDLKAWEEMPRGKGRGRSHDAIEGSFG
jgi:hypothetical protein